MMESTVTDCSSRVGEAIKRHLSYAGARVILSKNLHLLLFNRESERERESVLEDQLPVESPPNDSILIKTE